MADVMREDQLAEAFSRFRAEARGEIQPPGTQAVRHTTRRRRAIRVASVAVAVVFVVGVVAAVATPERTYPTLSQAEMLQLAGDAADLLPPGIGMGRYATAVTAQTKNDTYQFVPGGSPLQIVGGQPYDLVALCRGRGTVRVAWEAGGVTGSVKVVCGGDLVRVRLTPRTNSPSVTVRLIPDAQAIGRAGIAVTVFEFY